MPLRDSINLNIMPVESKEKISFFDLIVQWINSTGRHVLILIEVIVLVSLAINFYLSRQITNLNYRITQGDQSLRAEDNIELLQKNEKLQQKIVRIEGIENSKINWTEKIENFNQKIPEDLILNEYTFNKNVLNLSANVKSTQGFGIFIQNLINDEDIKSVILLKSKFDSVKDLFIFDMEVNY